MENQEAYEKARKRVESKVEFYTHLAAYVVVNAVLLIINLSTSPGYLWFKWPLMGWGIGLIFHGLEVFIFSEGSQLRERMIEKEMNKEAARNRQED